MNIERQVWESMSLKVITDKKDINRVVDYNDIYFNKIHLENNSITTKIMEEIDKAHYSSESTFIGRDKSLGALNKNLLSTGCKTLLNIAYNPNVCFSVAECGPNALYALSKLDNGIIYWENPVLFLTEDTKCDIEYKGKHYNKYSDFLSKVMG